MSKAKKEPADISNLDVSKQARKVKAYGVILECCRHPCKYSHWVTIARVQQFGGTNQVLVFVEHFLVGDPHPSFSRTS